MLSLISGQNISHFFTDTQNTTYILELVKQKREQTRTLVSSKRKKGEVCYTFVQLSVHLLAISSVYSNEIPTNFRLIANPKSAAKPTHTYIYIKISPMEADKWFTCLTESLHTHTPYAKGKQIYIYIYIYIYKFADRSRGRLEGVLFNSCYTKVLGWALLLFRECSTCLWSVPFNT